MMMSSNKKLAMSIIKNAGAVKEPSQGPNADFVDRGDKPKVAVEIEMEEPELDSSMGQEAAMSKFMLAVKANDPKKAAQAMKEFMAMCGEMEDEDSAEMEPSKEV